MVRRPLVAEYRDVTDDAPVAPPRDSWVDVFFGRRGFGMSSPFPAKVAFNVSEDAEGHRVFEFAEPDGQRHRWVVDKDHPSLVRSYAFWDRGAAPDARPFITAACVEEQQVGRQTIPRVIEWQQDAHFGSAGTMANRARIEILSFTLSPDSTRQPSDLLIKWPKGSFVRVQLTGSAPRDVQVETDRQAIE